MLKQGQFSPVPVEQQVAMIFLATNGLLDKVAVTKVKAFEKEFLAYLVAKHKTELDLLRAGKLEPSVIEVLKKVSAD